MGISVNDLLNTEFFRDFEVVAGRSGLNGEIQGITFLEAPDGYHWKMAKELCFSSGYIFSKEPNAYRDMFRSDGQPAALVIKRGRYLDPLPEDLIALCNEKGTPLITMPYSIAWMTVVNQVNVCVMNYAFQRFGVNSIAKSDVSQQNYKGQKIRKILRTVENEMEFPAFLYDIFEGQSYYSSPNFKKTSEHYGLKETDYWDPSIPHTRHTLCDCIHMTRFRLQKGEADGEPRISWVVIPILADGVPQAYFCVMESRKLLDFYDEYSMRVAYLMLQGIYEQIAVSRDANNIGFENLIHLALEYDEENDQKLSYQANLYGITMNRSYLYILFRHNCADRDIRDKRNELVELFRQCSMDRCGHLALLSKDEGLILLEMKGFEASDRAHIYALVEEYQEKLTKKFAGVKWTFSLCREPRGLAEVRASVEKCRKIQKIGRVVAPEQTVLDYEDLGILTWLDIPEEELKPLMEEFKRLLKAEKNRELLHTLKIYLENNMNYSLTAEKLFVNINTVRRRIEKVNELIQIDWDNYFSRTKVGLMLQFLQV